MSPQRRHTSTEVLGGLYAMATIAPALGFFAVAAILWFIYPLDKKRVEENGKILQKKRER